MAKNIATITAATSALNLKDVALSEAMWETMLAYPEVEDDSDDDDDALPAREQEKKVHSIL